MTQLPRLILTFLIACGIVAEPGLCQDVKWQVEVGFDGHYGADHWTQVTVRLRNEGPSTSGQVTTSASRGSRPDAVTCALPVDLPAGSQKTYRMLVPSLKYDQRVTLTSGSDTQVQTISGATPVSAEDLFVVVLAENQALLRFLNGLPAPGSRTGPTTRSGIGPSGGLGGSPMISLATEEWVALPESWLGWDGVDVVVVADAETGAANERQLEALRQWVQLGGLLIVTGGAKSPALAKGPLGDLLPVEVAGTRSIEHLGILEDWASRPIERRAALIAEGALRDEATVLLEAPGAPLITSRPAGSGYVLMSAFDFTAEPVRYWDGQEEFWQRLLTRGLLQLDDVPSNGFPPYVTSSGGATAVQSEEAGLPPLWLIGGFLLAYLIVLVPLNLAFVSRMGRRELAWLTTPLIVLVFFAGAWGTGYLLRGHRTLLNRVAVVRAVSGQKIARAEGYVGLFSPSKTSYNLQLGGTAAAALGAGNDSSSFTMEFGPRPAVRDLAVNMWSTGVIQAPFIADLGGGISGYLEWDGTDLSATVRNDTGMALTSVGLVQGGRLGRTIELAPGEEGRVDLIQTTELLLESNKSQPLAERALAAVFGMQDTHRYSMPSLTPVSGPPSLVALHEGAAVPVELVDQPAREDDVMMIAIDLPVRMKPHKGQIVPNWMMEQRVIDAQPAANGVFREARENDEHRLYLSTGGTVEVEFEVPSGPNGVEAVGLQVELYSSGYSLEVYNFSSGQWEPAAPPTGNLTNLGPPEDEPMMLPGMEPPPIGNLTTLDAPAEQMSEDGRVRVRISSQNEITIRQMGLRARVNVL